MSPKIEAEAEEQTEMADGLSGVVGMWLGSFMVQHVYAHKLGWVFNADTDFVLPGVGKRRPDLAFCSYATLPELPRTVVPIPPDLAVEIVSSRDEIDNADQKLKEYRQAGIKLIWVVRPIGEVVEVYRANGTTALLNLNDTLRGEEVIKDFELPLHQLFALINLPKTEEL